MLSKCLPFVKEKITGYKCALNNLTLVATMCCIYLRIYVGSY